MHGRHRRGLVRLAAADGARRHGVLRRRAGRQHGADLPGRRPRPHPGGIQLPRTATSSPSGPAATSTTRPASSTASSAMPADGTFKTQGDNRDELDPVDPRSRRHHRQGRPPHPHGRPGRRVPHQTGDVRRARRRRGRRRRRTTATSASAPPAPTARRHEPMKHLKRSEDRSWPPPGPRTDAPSRARPHDPPPLGVHRAVTSCLVALPVLAVTWSALQAPDSTQRVDTGRAARLRHRARLPLHRRAVGRLPDRRGHHDPQRRAGPSWPTTPSTAGSSTTSRWSSPSAPSAEGADDLAATYAVDVVVETPGGWSTTHPVHRAHRLRGHGHPDAGHRPPRGRAQVAAVAELTGRGWRRLHDQRRPHARPGRAPPTPARCRSRSPRR